MEEKNDIQLSRSFGAITIALLIWISLIHGVRNLINGFYYWTTFLLLGLGLIAPLIAFKTNMLEKLEQRKFERPRVLVTTCMYIAVGGIYLYDFTKSGQSIASDAMFDRFHSLGVLLLLCLALWQLFKSLRVREKSDELLSQHHKHNEPADSNSAEHGVD